MKKTVKKNYYLTPAVKVVAFQVEGGFAGSNPLKVGDPEVTSYYGTKEIRTDASTDSWAGSVIPH
jgi:hypothetical protein